MKNFLKIILVFFLLLSNISPRNTNKMTPKELKLYARQFFQGMVIALLPEEAEEVGENR